MSVNGVIQNVKWPELVLTSANGGAKVDGANFTMTDNQRVSRQLEMNFRPWC
jgi:hypothetical protein